MRRGKRTKAAPRIIIAAHPVMKKFTYVQFQEFKSGQYDLIVSVKDNVMNFQITRQVALTIADYDDLRRCMVEFEYLKQRR